MFNTFLYNPLLKTLMFLYENAAFHDLGIAIIILTFLVRLVLLPLFYKSAKNQLLLQKIQPLLQQIQHDHKDNKEKQAQAMMELYKTHKVNPFSNFLILFIQLPILIALYKVFMGDFSSIHPVFLNLINLQDKSIVMVGLAAIAQYFQGKLSLPKIQEGKELSAPERMGRQMVFIGPVLTLVILTNLPSAVGLYWLATSVFAIIQQIYINKTVKI
ncbi:MAG TPA: YidC/Oxa1 family membrane protein insertase [Candidatus Paceibacterota bacterium]